MAEVAACLRELGVEDRRVLHLAYVEGLKPREIAGLRLSADLVILGAFETAVGPTRPGEGSLALTRRVGRGERGVTGRGPGRSLAAARASRR